MASLEYLMDEAKRRSEQQKTKSAEAASVLENREYRAAFQTLETQYIEAFRGSKPTDADVREEAHRNLQALYHVETALRRVLQGGMLAEYNESISTQDPMNGRAAS